MKDRHTDDLPPDHSDPAPIFGSWERFYGFVLCYLAFVIALLYVASRVFHY
ncbi:MAG: hypothetical protein JOY62_08765 [Acidobacteriaceae bacterium]|nr:hypothetical protein [Acidobacteriaceae bacterium]MBV9780052.1 hypothetical protein [Acidobacteriaceae bacterium]